MKASVLHFQDLFHPPIHFVVPVFQRGYVWGQDANWKPLWAEVLAAYHRPDESHFLGAIVLEQTHVQTGTVETRRVVDGQQRLTTVQVILAVIRDIAAEQGRLELAQRVTALTANPGRTGLDSLKVWPSGPDQEAFAAVVEAAHEELYPVKMPEPMGARQALAPEPMGARQALAPEPMGARQALAPAIVAAYRYFDERVRELGDVDLERLVAVIVDGLSVVVLDLDPADDPQSLFEALNARGTQLRAGDLVRNRLFHLCERSGENTEDLYARFWAPFDTDYWRTRNTDGETSRMDEFLSDFLIMERRPAQHSRIYPEFVEYVRTGGRSAPEVMARLCAYARHYQSLDTLDGLTPEEATAAGRLRDVRINVFRPVLMRLLGEHDPADRIEALKAIESYVIRRLIMNWSSRRYADYLPMLLDRLAGPGNAAEAVREFLLGRSGDERWPGNAEIVAFVRKDRIADTRPRQVQFLLLLVEAQLRRRGTETVTVDTDELTIEHFLPEKFTPQLWPYASTNPAAQAREHKERRAVLDTLGNLSLVTKHFNVTLGNREWTYKRKRLSATSLLMLNRDLPLQWNVGTIRARSTKLAHLLCEALSHPNAPTAPTGNAPPRPAPNVPSPRAATPAEAGPAAGAGAAAGAGDAEADKG